MEPKEPMRALVYRVDELPKVEEVEGFKGIQTLCGGYIERVILDAGRLGKDRWIALWCNEDGISQGLEENVWAKGPSCIGAPIRGTAVILAGRRTKDDEEDLGLTDEEVRRWSRLTRLCEFDPLARTASSDRDEARREIEDLLGADGSRELAEAILRTLAERGIAWEDAVSAVDAMDEADWSAVIDESTVPAGESGHEVAHDFRHQKFIGEERWNGELYPGQGGASPRPSDVEDDDCKVSK